MENMNKVMMIIKRIGNLLRVLVIAAVTTALTFLLVGLLAPANSYVHALFFERSWIQYVTTFCFWTIIAILLFKQIAFNYEKKALENAKQVIKGPGFSSTFTWGNADLVRQKFEEENKEHNVYKKSIIFGRIANSLDRLRKTQSTRAFEEYFRIRSDIDSEELESSYADLRYFTWLIPTLGFIGTVMGIGIGIKGFAVIIENAQNFSEVQTYLPTVTGHLGTAFDTTLLALGLSIMAVFYMSFSLKRDEQLLENIDNFCFDGICPLFQEHSGASEEIITAFNKNVEEIRQSMIGNRAAIENVIREEFPVLLGDKLLPRFQQMTDLLANIALFERQILDQHIQTRQKPMEKEPENAPGTIETKQSSTEALDLARVFQNVADALERNNTLFEGLKGELENIRSMPEERKQE